MKPSQCLITILIFASTAAHAIVIRPDVSDSKYLVPENSFPALTDFFKHGSGHGVLISRKWIVTDAHIAKGGPIKQVRINGKWRNVSKIIVYPGYKQLPKNLRGKKSGDAAPLMKAAASSDEIALIKLVKPVDDVKPVPLYRGSEEQGDIVKIYGKGATGNGLVGQYKNSPHRGKLRRAYNQVTEAYGRWLNYRFNCGPKALPLEGAIANGDSGGPVLIRVNGSWKLAGLAAWTHWEGDLSNARTGVCGQISSNTRISHYAEWIDGIMAAHKKSALE